MTKDTIGKWKTTDSEYVVNNRWLKVRSETCVDPNGHVITPFFVMEYGEWANCVVVSDDGMATLLRHYRHGVQDHILEIIGGMVDDGETPERTIERELEEEIGLIGAKLVKTGVCYPNPQTHTNKLHCFIAIGGTFAGNREDEPGANFEQVQMPLKQFVKMIEDGDEIFQSLHISSVFFALSYLKKNHPQIAETLIS